MDSKILSSAGPLTVVFKAFLESEHLLTYRHIFTYVIIKPYNPPTETIAANASNSWSPIQGAFWRAGGIAPDLKLKDVLPRFTNEAVKVIDDHGAGTRKKPLMLYLAYPAPHTPWLPSKQFTGKSKVGMYGDFVMMVDAMIGRVLASLDRNGLTENTLLFFSSDNGPVWYESDRERFGHSSVGELRGMKADAWEGGHRMPFIARWPTTIEPGTSSDQMISFCDLLATFADLVGTELPNMTPDQTVSASCHYFLEKIKRSGHHLQLKRGRST